MDEPRVVWRVVPGEARVYCALVPSFGERHMVALDDGLLLALAGRYEREREIGQGGMAVVYLARGSFPLCPPHATACPTG